MRPEGLMSEEPKLHIEQGDMETSTVGKQREKHSSHISLFYGLRCRPCRSAPRSCGFSVHVTCDTCAQPVDLFSPHGMSNRHIFPFSLQLFTQVSIFFFNPPSPLCLSASGDAHTMSTHRLIN